MLHTIDPGILEQVRITFLQAGSTDDFQHKLVHEKTVPFAIIAIPKRGQYEVSCPAGSERIATGEAFLTAPHLPLRITHLGTGRPRRMAACWLHFSATVLDTVEITSLLKMPLKLGRTMAAQHRRIIEDLLSLQSERDSLPLHPIRANALGWQALYLLLRQCPPNPDARQLMQGPASLRRLLVYLRQHLAYPITVQQMATIAGVSVSHLHHTFYRTAGRTPMAFVKYLRLNEAACRLVASDDSINDISASLGFSNQFHFSREFRRQFDVAPTEYRQLHRHPHQVLWPVSQMADSGPRGVAPLWVQT